MPGKAKHLAEAEWNEQAADALLQTQFADWAVVALFYAALHLVDAYLASTVHPKDHTERFSVIAVTPLERIYADHRELYQRSLDARYGCVAFSVTQAQAFKNVKFDSLKQGLEPLL